MCDSLLLFAIDTCMTIIFDAIALRDVDFNTSGMGGISKILSRMITQLKTINTVHFSVHLLNISSFFSTIQLT